MRIDKFISHRGANTDFVENTIKSFEIAKNYGFRWFEIDVQMSKDGELFLFHDKTCQRLASLNSEATEMRIDELKGLEIIHPTLGVKATIPTFKEYLDWAIKNDVYTNVEIKINKNCLSYKNSITIKVLDTLNGYPEMQDKIFISSFSNTVMKFLEQDKKYQKGKLHYTTNWDEDFDYINTTLYSDFQENKYLALIINYECLSQHRLEYLRQKFGKVFVYSAHSDYEVETLLSWGADAIFVDKKEQIHLKAINIA
ncbi:glycerophosphoryl diester phosphodiesterase [Allofrancisella guangzhouensis]|uniref:Glycerophosphodiester phosphodiesterase n=1 Tax=Allofrancisella guangzhouensis TaxID=594679 RepID=A0A0A8E3I0_9GAMM|nr:glycerophosphodiester phosphodiesterase family protein [Allofrancisella guangzhouensis]AJC48785.1 glycerophosphodiester phosphodiesterase [Allofrancisella guangzhouensis]MBK2028006.1 glycerophosphoryl diester phosphodiesterase [Allofrancisella guangzhouensis]MBK2044412.1 glycerophosphoryl diester phosphodiesterase [Allofrancisella guangzhouensis]MBK2045282.1 glycerophosphoryl diester phosphodiesterase [Allofrancisella guangzhouensis]